ncbi:MAG TPA: helix-turn-helix domain-containing protein [Microbacterium sp.]|nr:helix-turn-helix domain-containing protein [Microbacterium sp.]
MVRRTRSEESPQQLASLSEAAEKFGVSVKTLRRRIADGTIRGYRIGRLIRVDLHELQNRLLIEMPSTR